MSEAENKGQGDVDVSHFNVISSSGKQLKEISPKSWNAITYTESMGLLAGDTQFLSGEVTINDSINIFNEMALVGDEVVELRFKTPQKEEIDFVGRVYNVGVTRPNKDTRIIKLKFCSAEKITADQLKVNRAYREVKYSDMAKDIFTPLNVIGKKKIYAEETKNNGSIIINNKSPIDVLNMITKVSRSAEYQGANYVLFEQSGGVFQFVSLESLVDPAKVKPSITYVVDPPTGKKNDLRKLASIRGYKIAALPNTIANIQNGVYGSTMVSNDLMKRKVSYSGFNYDESYSKYKSVNYNEVGSGQGKTSLTNNKTYGERNSSNIRFVPKHYGSFDTRTNYADEREDAELIRNSQMRQINAIRLHISVSGDSQRRVGEVIKLNIPTLEETGGNLDEILSGRYLVSKVQHIISSVDNQYITTMEVVADSFTNPLPTKA
jgi:hypothetical protein